MDFNVLGEIFKGASDFLCDSCGYGWMFDIPKEKIRLINLKIIDPLPQMEDVREYKRGSANKWI